MLIEHRTYTVRPGTLKRQLALYEQFGFHAQPRNLGRPVAFLVTETGELNSYVHIWAFSNAGDREQRRGLLAADPEWKEYLEKSAAAAYIVKQESKLMTPAAFAPLVLS